MKLLHTSDWHLGKSLEKRTRYAEFSAFLDWLEDTIKTQNIDTLLVSGDIFDTATPGSQAQTLYYQFLVKVARHNCRNIIITAGNHDSPSFLNAPRELLLTLNITVIGSISDNINDEIIIIRDDQNNIEAVICAVPYLRDKDVRVVSPGESYEDKAINLTSGITKHYADITAAAQQIAGDNIPIIAMGHLFTSGGKTLEKDGVRDLYVGSLAHLKADAFPERLNYVALGHLHVPQRVKKKDHIRYCGSPIPMGFGEAAQTKQVVIVEFNGCTPVITPVDIPCFQQLENIKGSMQDILKQIEVLKQKESSAWLKIEYTGKETMTELSGLITDAVNDTGMEIRLIKNRQMSDKIISSIKIDEALESLDATDVFTRCLDAYEVPESERSELTSAYNEIITLLDEEEAS